MKASIHPGASKESLSNEKQPNAKSPALHLGKQVTKAAESCPWDFPDPPKNLGDICPWEEENIEPTNTGSTTQIKIDICPWEAGHQDEPQDLQKGISPLRLASVQTDRKDDTKVNICPWDTDLPETNAATKIVLKGPEKLADVCPWESGKPESEKPQTPKTSESHVKQDTARTSVCPWDTEEAGVVKTEVSKISEKLQGQGNSREVCLCDTEAPKVLKKQDSVRADVCPWETDEPKVLQKQDSVRADVCPWETDEPKVLQKQDSVRADVCPWEAEEPEVVKKQDSSEAYICPWESQDPQTSTEIKVDIPNSAQDEVTETQGSFSVEDTSADNGREQIDESRENLALGRRDALCPWEMERSRSSSFTDNASDIFTWEPENIPEEDEEDDDAECAAEAFVFPPDL
ncbi:probable G-protein coupled receptor 179 isoform X2 [Perca flavescens]|uniref:probable G-protein coupled receptor 179 isoform X2 n=1 Tax=Perca flavescens TaxID=8167 RepID=UPI00106E3AD8|nr:probable G-protein coupled receptor 179 isoform X2 [Perca flavescens]